MPLQSTLASQRKGLCLLSLDAGGIQNTSQLKILAELMHRLNFDLAEDQKVLPCDVFDMIGGSGTGGFVAILLVALGLNAELALEELIEFSVNILEKQGVEDAARTTQLKGYIDGLLNKHLIDENMRLMDLNHRSKGCKLVIPILRKCQIGHPCILCNFEACQEEALNFTIADAILATLASPPLFTPIPVSNDVSTSEYISGDLTLSNPTRTIVSEAYETFGEEARVACLLSIGCGHPGVISAPDKSDLENWNQFLEKVVKDGERTAAEIDSQMGRLGLYYRFSVTRGMEGDRRVNASAIGDAIGHTAVYLSELAVTRKVAMCVESLTSRDGIASLDQLTHSGSQNVIPPTLPPLTQTFVMRKGPWKAIEQAIFGVADTGDVEGPKMLAVTGMGGCGKTQIVLKFLRVHRRRFELCLFVDGNSAPQIRADVMRHVRSLGIVHAQKSFEECLLLLSQPCLSGQRVIIYDNVDDPGLDLAPLLPTGDSCAIIVTSRNRLIGELCPRSHLELDVMSREEAIDLLLYSTDRSTTITEQAREDAGAIAQALGCLPIALQQARSYMSQTKCSARAYLDKLVESRGKLLTEQAKFQLDMDAVSTYAAFETSFKKLTPSSQKFLRLLSYFHWSKFPLELVILAAKYNFSEYRITYTKQGEDFHKGKALLEDIFLREGKWSTINLDKIMVDLQSYSLITSIPGVDTLLLHMHPLVHGWVRSCILGHEVIAYRCAAVMLLALGSRSEYTPPAQYLASHITHISSLWDQLHINNAGAFADILDRGGMSQGALKLREKVYTELCGQAEPDSMAIVNSIRSFARTYRHLGRYKDAEPLQREVLRLTTEIQGKQNPSTITASNNLALIYHKLGRPKDAEVLQEEVLKLRKNILGEQHPDTMKAANNLANTYRRLRRTEDARVLREGVLKFMKETLGERHPDTMKAYNNLANTYRDLGRLKEAEMLQKEVLKLRKEILGARHPDTVKASNNLANTYYALGQLDGAVVLHEEVFTLRKEMLGWRHPDTIAASNNLAFDYCEQGRVKDAESLQLETLRQAEEILGKEHPTTTLSMLTMAKIYESLNRKTDVLKLLDKAEPIITEKLGKEHWICSEYRKITTRMLAMPDLSTPTAPPSVLETLTSTQDMRTPDPLQPTPYLREKKMRRWLSWLGMLLGWILVLFPFIILYR